MNHTLKGNHISELLSCIILPYKEIFCNNFLQKYEFFVNFFIFSSFLKGMEKKLMIKYISKRKIDGKIKKLTEKINCLKFLIRTIIKNVS